MERRWVLSLLLIIGIIGYFTIPTVAGWIIQSGGAGAFGGAVNKTAAKAGGIAGGLAGAATGNVAGRAGSLISKGYGAVKGRLQNRGSGSD